MSETLWAAIIAGILGVGGTIIGAFVGNCMARKTSSDAISASNRNAIDLIQRQEFNNASAIFRNIFLPETTYLKHNANIGGLGSSSNLHEILSAGYLRQLKALVIFKIYLSGEDRINIDKAWHQYCHHPDNPNDLYFEQYSTKNVSKERENELKNIALNRIENLLKFAKHK